MSKDTNRPTFDSKTLDLFTFLFLKKPHLKFLHPLGTGAYGSVVAVEDTKTKTKLAIKRISNLNNYLIAERTLREIQLLQHFTNQKYIINLYNIQILDPNINSVFLFQECMETDLYFLIYFHKHLLNAGVIKKIGFQVANALAVLHKAKVMHRDIKPSNILVKNFCEVKLCDFGLARDKAGDFEMSPYVQTRWYRAPELLFKNKNYDEKIDVWSFGCVMAEMVLKKPLFAGKNAYAQLVEIYKILGKPSNEVINKIESKSMRAQIVSCPERKKKSWEKVFKNEFGKLMEGVLVYDADERLSIEQVISSDYFKGLEEEKCDIQVLNLKKVEKKNYKKEIVKEAEKMNKSEIIEKTVVVKNKI